MKPLVVLATLLVAGTVVMAQSPVAPLPCQSAEQRQFDFWVGQWDVFGPGGEKAGINRIVSIDNGCVLLERWSGADGSTGTSLNSWDARAGQWRQHWVDNNGGLLRLAGIFVKGSMVLSSNEPHPRKPGAMLTQRIAWTPLADGAVRQHWERSEDDGKSWTTAFDGRYVRQP